MPYGDEEIIRALMAAEGAKRNSELHDATIAGLTYQFEPREFRLGFSMLLPTNFDPLAPESAKLIYPYENRPKIILSNEDATANLAFDCMAVAPEEPEARLKKYVGMVKKLHPDYAFLSRNIYILESGLKAVCYDYRGIALDGDIYYLSFFTDLPDGELFGWFNCPIELQTEWEPLARRMIRTIKPIPQEEGEQ